jgi:hypothetical protein
MTRNHLLVITLLGAILWVLGFLLIRTLFNQLPRLVLEGWVSMLVCMPWPTYMVAREPDVITLALRQDDVCGL